MLIGTHVRVHVYARGQQASTMSRVYDVCVCVSVTMCVTHIVCVGSLSLRRYVALAVWLSLCVPLWIRLSCIRLSSENVLRSERCSLQAPAGEAVLSRF